MPAIQSTEAKVWDARAEFALGVFIRRYLRDDPPPPGSLLESDVQRLSDNLLSTGRTHLQALGAHHLRTVLRDATDNRCEDLRANLRASNATDRRAELYAENLKAERAWRDLSVDARESLLLKVLGDDRLLLRELTLRMNAALGYTPQDRTWAVYDAHVRYLAAKMIRQGRLERSHERFNGAKIRNRYHRPGAITAPEGGE